MQWTHFEAPATIFALAAQPAGKCLAATEHGLWQLAAPPPKKKGAIGIPSKTRRWQQIAPQFAHVPLLSVATHGNTICIGSAGDIAISHDEGKTWTLAILPVKAHVLALSLSPAFNQDHIGLAATAQDGVLRTADSGATWHAWNYGLLDLGVNAIELSSDFANDATCFAASDHGLFTSSNSGRAWTELPIGMKHGPFTAIALTKSISSGNPGCRLIVGSEGNGLWSSAQPFDAWDRVKGLRADEINDLLPNIAATTKGVFMADGDKWMKALDDGAGVCLAHLDDGTLIVGTAGNGVWRGYK